MCDDRLPSPSMVITDMERYNAVIVNLHENKSISATLSDDVAAIDAAVADLGSATKKIETGCLVVITLNLENLMRALKRPLRKEMKTWFSVSSPAELLSTPRAFLSGVEMVLDTILVKNCSSCNNQNPASSESRTEKGDQPLNKKSGRWVYLNEDFVIQQDGIYYGHYFVPTRKGKLLKWFSSPRPSPKQISARLCCLLNFLNSFKYTEKGIVQDFTAMVYVEPKEDAVGPLDMKRLKERDLEKLGPVSVIIQL